MIRNIFQRLINNSEYILEMDKYIYRKKITVQKWFNDMDSYLQM